MFDAGRAQRAPESIVLDFRFPARRNARVSVGLSERKLSFKKVGLWTTSTPRNTHIIFCNCGSPCCCASQAQYETADANERNVHPCGACSSVGLLQECILHGTGRVSSLDSSTSTSSSSVPFTPATFNPCNVGLGLVEFVSTPTPSSSGLNSSTSNLTPATSAHYDPFHMNPLPTHTRDVRTRAAGDE